MAPWRPIWCLCGAANSEHDSGMSSCRRVSTSAIGTVHGVLLHHTDALLFSVWWHRPGYLPGARRKRNSAKLCPQRLCDLLIYTVPPCASANHQSQTPPASNLHTTQLNMKNLRLGLQYSPGLLAACANQSFQVTSSGARHQQATSRSVAPTAPRPSGPASPQGCSSAG